MIISFLLDCRKIGDRPLVRAIFLYIGLSVVLVAWTLIPCIGWLTGPGMLLAAAGMILPLLAPVVVMERRGARDSLRRAWELVRRRFWWIFGFMLLLYLFNWVVVSGPSMIVGLLLGFVFPEQMAGGDIQTLYNIQTVTQALVGLVVSVLYLPLQLSCLTLLYFDLRVRLEGLDLVFTPGTGPNDPESIRQKIAESAPPISGSLLAGKEFLNFSAISAMLVGLYFVLFISLGAIILAAGGF